MTKITDNMIQSCLLFLHKHKGEVSRYSFDKFITLKININESFNLIPIKLLEDGLISINHDDEETKIRISTLGIKKLKNIKRE
ncbi:hypothetical protein K5X82_01820 [Halosquirtibacter xylanolyticus]|uniref:hypothetical protein n=1 Tax=Halosquirtibacter xylanolyticus TaxID=3374599 RepID=UPI003748CB83|nr:hypothetical protein K5X82_01820 [Prolixibacteraceae bacterium]